ncbi:hypothetical protein RJ641_034853 [Dillenia turbinata]|uniref:Uncharacterized protein n=1 Tax=Dillenia turbinata TaxID=194707 RepID=A0AAN8ZHZ3_9MAGN
MDQDKSRFSSGISRGDNSANSVNKKACDCCENSTRKEKFELQMLSIENNPPDPPCTRDISSSEILITDERASSDKLALPLQEVDLLFPKFSIRDYVFTARSNDIKRNWPFSLRSLELCLKHGVKDVLPPFQTIQSVRDQSFDKCLLDDNLLQKENITTDGKDYTGPTNQSSLASSDEVGLNETLVGGCTDPSLSIFKEEDERSEEPNFSQSESQPVLDNQPKCSRKLTDSLLEPQEGTKVACEVELQKAESTSQFSGEKCRLIVKFGNSSDPAVAADTTTTCATLPESMASNVCPVCKTFSSSSNTTLNAHIDQCLSAESTPKWGANSKLIRHRIKPRKTRLMVDICATAPRCTLEELDRRNGRNWATSSSLTTQDSEVHTQVKKQKVSPVHVEDTGGEGAVYFDADGTKVRILSKFNDAPSVSKVPELARPGKHMKEGKRNKYLSKHMKRRHRTKNKKYLKLSPHGRTLSSKDVNLEMHGDQEESNGITKNHNEEHLLQVRKALDQVKLSDSGNLRQWVCSKRTGPSKKSRRGHQLAGYDFHVTRNMLTGNDQSCLNDPPVERNVCGSPLSSENLTASPESIQMQDLSFEVCATGNMEPSLRAKKSHSPLFGAQCRDAAKRSIKPTQKNVDQISKGSSCLYDDLVPKPPKHIRNNYASLRKEMVVETCEDSVGTCDNFPDASIRVPRVSQVPSSVGTRSASLRKNILPLNPCMHKSKFNVFKKVSSTGKSQARFKAKGRKMVVLPSESDEGDDVTSDHNLDQLGCSNSRKAVHKVDKAGNLLSSETLEHSQGKGLLKTSVESSTLSGRHSLPLDCERDLRQNINALSDEFVGKCVQPSTETQCVGKDNADGSSSQKLEENEFQKICSSPYDQSNLLQSVEEYVGPLYSAGMLTRSMETNLCGDQQMITSGNRHGIGRQETHVVMETACKLNQETSYSEVDPIPIPGPPGSFLPSPRDMGSADLHGNSSLTTCRVQSSQDKHDLVDRDSSESPISTTSTISNSAPEGSPPKYSRQVLSVTHVLKDDSSPGLFDAGMKPTLLDASSVPQTSNKVAETVLGGDNVNADLISSGKDPFSFKDDGQPCRCSCSISWGVGLNYQESLLLKRRMASAMMQPIMGKQSSCNEIVRASNSNSRQEAYSVGNSSNVSSEEGFLPMSKVSMGCSPVKVSVDSAPKFPSRGDCDSNSPSASNPVLRLMGKNLMVVNKDEDLPMQSEGHVSNGHPSSQYQTFSGVTPGKPQSQDLHYSSAVVPQGTPVLEQVFRRCYNVPSNFSSDINAVRPQMPLVVQAGCFPTEHASVTSGSTLGMHGTQGEYNVLTQQNRPKSRSDTSAEYTFQRRTAKSNVGSSKAGSTPNSYKEIIIIDDAPENGAEMAVNLKYSNGLSRKQVCPVGMPGNYPTYTNPFPRYPSPSLGKSPVLQNVNFHPPNSRQPTANPVKWDYSSEGSRVMPQSSYMIPSPSTSHPRSVLYFSSSLS